MQIRKIEKTDFPLLYSLWESVGLWIYSFDKEKLRFEEMLRLNPNICFLLEGENNIIGSILGSYDGRSVFIHRLAVDIQHQKKGYGKMLVEHLEEECKKRNIKKIVLQVHESNDKVVPFYKKLGYENDPLITLKKEL